MKVLSANTLPHVRSTKKILPFDDYLEARLDAQVSSYGARLALSGPFPVRDKRENKSAMRGRSFITVTCHKPTAVHMFGVELELRGDKIGVVALQKGIACDGGLQVDDILHEVNGEPLRGAIHAAELLGESAPGIVTISVFRSH